MSKRAEYEKSDQDSAASEASAAPAECPEPTDAADLNIVLIKTNYLLVLSLDETDETDDLEPDPSSDY
jgi:hypothetical protein